jgi:hypothetical protein
MNTINPAKPGQRRRPSNWRLVSLGPIESPQIVRRKSRRRIRRLAAGQNIWQPDYDDWDDDWGIDLLTSSHQTS